MSAPNDRRIKTYNQLENKSIQLIIERTPHVNYFCTSASVPGISGTAARLWSPFTDVKVTGDKLVFQPLIVNFIVDENLENWNEIFKWMSEYAHPEGFDQYADNTVSQNNLYRSKISPATLLVSNNKYNLTHEFRFIDLFPVDLSDIVFDNQISDTQVQIATVTFEYTVYSKVPLIS